MSLTLPTWLGLLWNLLKGVLMDFTVSIPDELVERQVNAFAGPVDPYDAVKNGTFKEFIEGKLTQVCKDMMLAVEMKIASDGAMKVARASAMEAAAKIDEGRKK